MNAKMEKAAEKFAALMIDKIKSIENDWKKGWIDPKAGIPVNIRGTAYGGMNSLMLYFHTESNKFKTPVFLTRRQAEQKRVTIKTGSESHPVFYYLNIPKYKIRTRENVILESKTYIPIPRVYEVFNLDQTDYAKVHPDKWIKVLDDLREKNYSDGFRNKNLDGMIKHNRWVCPIHIKQSSKAYYSPLNDYIVLPKWEQFPEGSNFYSTLLHEMAHSTGHPDRLNRDIRNFFGTEKYAKEELVAELTAAISGMFLGMSAYPQPNNARYLKSWLYGLNESPEYILNILMEVKRATGMIMEKVNIDNTYSDKRQAA